jgi:protein TonB
MSQFTGKTHRHGVSRAVDPRLFMPWSEVASRNRLSSTLFLAGLFHGIILLGVTFTSDDAPPEPSVTSFEVVLVTDESTIHRQQNDVELLAQQNRVGAGNTRTPMQLQTALNQMQPAEALGPEQTGQQHQRQPEPAEMQDRPTIVARSLAAQLTIPERLNDRDFNEQEQARSFEGETNAIEIVNKPEPKTLISDNKPRELIISANTREARIAAYLSRWKNRIERIGTLNFPNAVESKGLTQFPTLEVAIDADGNLNEVIIRNSSGLRALDQDAINIVKISAPFDPFPEFLRAEYDVLRFAYEWRFTDSLISSRL